MIKKTLIYLIRLYQNTISPLLGTCCRFYPSCSSYMIEALEMHSLFKGLWLGCKRLCKCHPWHPGGYDPVASIPPLKTCPQTSIGLDSNSFPLREDAEMRAILIQYGPHLDVLSQKENNFESKRSKF